MLNLQGTAVCLGGNGYVEDSGMPRLYREAPLNSIWEGSGNVNALDVLRALAKQPEALERYFSEVELAVGADARLDAFMSRLRNSLGPHAEGRDDGVAQTGLGRQHGCSLQFRFCRRDRVRITGTASRKAPMTLSADDSFDYTASAGRLLAMGLDPRGLRKAAARARADADEATLNDVQSWGEWTFWAKYLRYLGEEFAISGFRRDCVGGLDTLVSPGGEFQLAIAPGDRNTGTPQMPKTRHDRGPLTSQAVDRNRHQLRLDHHQPVQLFKAADDPKIWTWTLLHYLDRHTEELRLELSLPVERTRADSYNRSHLTAFEPRLRIEPLDLSTEMPAWEGDDDDVDSTDIDIDIRRKP